MVYGFAELKSANAYTKRSLMWNCTTNISHFLLILLLKEELSEW